MASRTVTAYTFFGVAPDCSQAALRHAYDAMVARHHPDKAWSTPTAAASKTGMQEVNRWYALVATDEARAAYDRTLQQKLQQKPHQKPHQKHQPTTLDPLNPGSATPARSKPRRKPVHGSRPTQQQLVLSRPPLLRPVALFCALVVSAAQAVAVAGGWARHQAAAVRRRRRVLVRGAGVLVVAAAAASLLLGWPAAGGPAGWWLGPCAAPAPFAANRHYRQLGLADGGPATPLADIRKAYHQAIRRHHPDKQRRWPPQEVCASSRRLRAIGEAYQVLRDPQTRCAYDAQQQRRRSLWLRAPARDCPHAARWASAWDEAPGLSTARDAVALWHAGQVAVFQTVQSLWASVWASVRGLAGRVAALVR